MAEEPQEWLTATQAARLLGAHRRTLERLGDQLVIAKERDDDAKPWLYSRRDIETYKQQKAAGRLAPVTGEDMLAQAYGLIKDLQGPSRQFGEMLQKENTALRDRCAALEKRHDELISVCESLLNDQVVRDLAATQATAVEERKERAFKLVETTVGPKLLGLIGGKSSSAGKLLDTLTEDQLTLLLNTDLIDEDQKVLLRDVLKAKGATIETTGVENAS